MSEALPVKDYRVTRHAVRRYRKRLRQVPMRRATDSILRCLQTGTINRRPPECFGITAAEGRRYCYSPEEPDLCLILVDDTVVTVYSTRSCRQWAVQAAERTEARRRIRSRRSHV